MMKITQFDKRTLRMITDDIDKALAPLGVKYGLVFTYKGCRFNDKAATFKVEGATISEDGETNSQDRMDFIKFAPSNGLDPGMLDQNVILSYGTFTITGFNPKRWKNPITATRVDDGARFKLPVDVIRLAWDKTHKAVSVTKKTKKDTVNG